MMTELDLCFMIFNLDQKQADTEKNTHMYVCVCVCSCVWFRFDVWKHYEMNLYVYLCWNITGCI